LIVSFVRLDKIIHNRESLIQIPLCHEHLHGSDAAGGCRIGRDGADELTFKEGIVKELS
jgi:hypothetical protein